MAAALRALANAKVEARELDLIILATATGDRPFPSTACLVQEAIGATKAAAFDVAAVCSGYVYGLTVADQFIRCGTYKKILLVGADAFSKVVDWTDRSTCVLCGDGASAAVITASDDESGILDVYLGADGRAAELLMIPGGGSREPITEKNIAERRQYVKMRGGEVYKMAVKATIKAIQHILKKNKLTLDEIDLIVPHQANVRILSATAEKLKISREKIFVNLEKYGNTSAASVGLALDDAVREQRIKKGDLVLLVAFGGGFTWGATLIQW